MQLYLTRRNLNGIAGIDLAGITPLVEKSIAPGDGSDYDDRSRISGRSRRNQLGLSAAHLLGPLFVLRVEGEIERPVVVDRARVAATLVGQGEDLGQVEEDVGIGVFQWNGNPRQGSLIDQA